ncbi:MAG TPA: alpha/beta hydrolase, partial [Candidatus Limnocylindria bacterium]|nr:alpha/beta hydrolase [Candidatus Limnocylindria bacterium]
MREFARGGLRLWYEERGEGVPLLFLHGMGGSHRQVFAALDPMPGVRLIAPDMQGHGESGAAWDGFGFSSLADDAAALADDLGIGEFWLGGISLGAAVGVTLALRRPGRVKGLALVRPAWTDAPMAPDVRRLYALCAQYLGRSDLDGFMKAPEYASVSALSAYTAGALTSFFRDPASLEHFRKFEVLPPSVPYSGADLKGLPAVPTIVIACRNDLVHPFELAEWHRDRIPGARLYEIPDKDTDPEGHRAQMNAHI